MCEILKYYTIAVAVHFCTSHIRNNPSFYVFKKLTCLVPDRLSSDIHLWDLNKMVKQHSAVESLKLSMRYHFNVAHDVKTALTETFTTSHSSHERTFEEHRRDGKRTLISTHTSGGSRFSQTGVLTDNVGAPIYCLAKFSPHTT